MKKTMVMIALASVLAMSASVTGFSKERDDDFHGHWFITAQGGVGLTIGETSFGKLISPAVGLSFGYHIAPVWSVRAGVAGWQAKGAILNPTVGYKYNYLQGNVDVLVDICNIFSEYKMTRTLNPYLFAGVGVNGAFNNDEANAVAYKFSSDNLLWNGSIILPVGRFGVGLGIRLSNAIHFNIEANGNFMGDKFNSKKGSPVDWQLNALAGLTFNLGMKKNAEKVATKKAAEEAAVAAAAAAAAAKAAEEARAAEEAKAAQEKAAAEAKAAEEAAAKAAEEAAAAAAFEPVKKDIFFVIGKWDIREQEAAKLDEIAAALKANPSTKVTVTGYADPQTGTTRRNNYLSKRRAEGVAAYLKAAGIEADRVLVEWKGSTESPYPTPSENRVAICIVDK